ncbi:MAG: hypothetical protein GXN98_04290, partial [Euryarchaeota archaeon]|nr:hypothetical protein [Euryarchaeota archaeon]
GNAFVQNYGRLALTVGRSDTRRGYRVALRREAWQRSALMKKWMLREGKLTRDEERKLAEELLNLEEEWLEVTPVQIEQGVLFENSSIVKCTSCGELVPESLCTGDGEKVCRCCSGEAYYRRLDADASV